MEYLLATDGEFWKRWDAHYADLGIGDRYCLDGVADVSRYKEAPRRVLFVLKEPNKWGGRADMRAQLRKGPEHLVWHNVARWAAGLLNDFPPYEEIAKPEVKRDAFRSVAAINLKKASGQATSDDAKLNLFAYRDRELLREQITSIDPDVVVACGRGVFGPLIWMLGLQVGDSDPLGEPARDTDGDIVVIPWCHPAKRAKKKALYYGLADRAAKAGIGQGRSGE